MKVCKVLRKIFQPKPIERIENSIPSCPIIYNRNNVTIEEFRKYVHWLATNNVNRTFYEPDKFITQAEREVLEKRKADLEEYRKFVRNLAENNISRTFYC